MVALARRRGGEPEGAQLGGGSLPSGFHALPGPASILGANFESSPVGPYVELAIGEPVRAGAHLGMCVTTMVVDSPDSRLGGRLNWGFPKELGKLRWRRAGEERVLQWDERDLEVRATVSGPGFPVVMPVRSIQQRADGLALVPGRLRGWGRRARVEVTVPDGDPLCGLVGRHWGVVVSGACLVVKPARHPSGLRAPLRAPGTAPEPALSLGPSHWGD